MKWYAIVVVFSLGILFGFCLQYFALPVSIANQQEDSVDKSLSSEKQIDDESANDEKISEFEKQIIELYRKTLDIQQRIIKIFNVTEAKDILYHNSTAFHNPGPWYEFDYFEPNPEYFKILKKFDKKERKTKLYNFVFWSGALDYVVRDGGKEELLWGFDVARERNILNRLEISYEVYFSSINDVYDDIYFLRPDGYEVTNTYYIQIYEEIVKSMGTDQYKMYAKLFIKNNLYLIKQVFESKNKEIYHHQLNILKRFVDFDEVIQFPKINDPKYKNKWRLIDAYDESVRKFISAMLTAKWDIKNNRFVLHKSQQTQPQTKDSK